MILDICLLHVESFGKLSDEYDSFSEIDLDILLNAIAIGNQYNQGH